MPNLREALLATYVGLHTTLGQGHSLLSVSFTAIVCTGVRTSCQAVMITLEQQLVLQNHPGRSELRMLSPCASAAEPDRSGLNENGPHRLIYSYI